MSTNKLTNLLQHKHNSVQELNYKQIKLDKNMDIVIPDLCFIKFNDKINLKIYIKDNVEIYTRENLI